MKACKIDTDNIYEKHIFNLTNIPMIIAGIYYIYKNQKIKGYILLLLSVFSLLYHGYQCYDFDSKYTVISMFNDIFFANVIFILTIIITLKNIKKINKFLYKVKNNLYDVFLIPIILFSFFYTKKYYIFFHSFWHLSILYMFIKYFEI